MIKTEELLRISEKPHEEAKQSAHFEEDEPWFRDANNGTGNQNSKENLSIIEEIKAFMNEVASAAVSVESPTKHSVTLPKVLSANLSEPNLYPSRTTALQATPSNKKKPPIPPGGA